MLHALMEFASREGLSAEPGFKTKAIRWQLVFFRDGRFVGIQDMSVGEGKQRRPLEVGRCPDLSQGEMISGGAGCRPFLVDGLDVVLQLGRDKIDDAKRAFFDAKHAYWVDLVRTAAEVVPELAAVAETLSDDDKLAAILAESVAKKAKGTELATIAILDSPGAVPRMIVAADVWHDWWRSFRTGLAAAREAPKGAAKPRKGKSAKKATSEEAASEAPADAAASSAIVRDPSRMLCLMSGEWISPQPTHPKINGLASVGGHSAGDVLSSFDKEAFCSYGLEQGANAAISSQMAAVYSAAFNKLLKDENRCVSLAGAKVVYWFSQSIPRELDPIQEARLGAFFSDDEEEGGEREEANEAARERPSAMERLQAESSARKLHRAIKSGEHPELANARFYAVTLSGNAGRVVVRDVMEGRFEELAANVAAWFEDLSIVSRRGDAIVNTFKFNSVLAAPFRELKDAPAPAAAALWRAALGAGPIPSQLLAATLRRTSIDIVQGESPRHARYGVLKACINRLFRTQGVPGMTTELKPVADGLQEHPAYICGQVMGVLAKIQKAALPGVKSGVIERFYAAAMATPALVLGRLVRTAEVAHIPLIRKGADARSGGLAAYFQRMLADVWVRLREKPPTALTLEEQTLFALGYYHQLAFRKVKLADGTTVDVDVAADSETAD